MLSSNISNCKTFYIYTQTFPNMFRHYVFVVLWLFFSIFSILKIFFYSVRFTHMLVENIKARNFICNAMCIMEMQCMSTLAYTKRVYAWTSMSYSLIIQYEYTSTLQYKLQVFSQILGFYNLSKKLSKTWTMFFVLAIICAMMCLAFHCTINFLFINFFLKKRVPLHLHVFWFLDI